MFIALAPDVNANILLGKLNFLNRTNYELSKEFRIGSMIW